VEPNLAKEVVKAILAAVFFHRLFPSIRPKTRDLLDLTLPSVDDSDLDALIESRTSSMIRSIESTPGASSANSQIAKRSEARKEMESQLQHTILRIIDIVNNHKDHIPPITTSDYNPFPYKIYIPQKDNWSGRFF